MITVSRLSGSDPPVIDARLVPTALATWGITLVGFLVSWRLALVLAVLSGVVAVVLLVRLRFAGRARPGLLGALAVLAAAGAVVAVTVGRVETHPLRSATGQELVVEATIIDDPRPVRSSGYGSRPGGTASFTVTARLRSVGTAQGMDRMSGRVLLVVPSAGWHGILPGQEVRVRAKSVRATGDGLTVGVLRVTGPPELLGRPPWWQLVAGDLRAGLVRACSSLSPEAAGLLPGLVVGDTTGQSRQVVDEFRAAGLSHLTAVSGANVAIVCGAVLLLCRVSRLGPRLSVVLAGLALIGFVFVARPQPSVLRAAAMGAVTLLALVLGRRASAMPALSASVIGLLLVDPELGVELGFALSVVATAGLVVLAPRWAGRLRDHGVPPGLAEVLAVPAAAFLVTAPLIAGMSGRLGLLTVIANLLAEPMVAPATILGALATVIMPLHEGIARALVSVAEPGLRWVILVARRVAAVPGTQLPWPSGLVGGLALAVVLIVIVVALRRGRGRVVVVTALVLAVLLVPVRRTFVPWPTTGWSVLTCDVGQGDATVLATTEPGQAVVIDTGPEPLAVNACLRTAGVRAVPLVVISHLHADHIGGLAGVVDGRQVGAVVLSGVRRPDWAFERVDRIARGVGLVPRLAVAGQRWSLPGLELEVIAPTEETTVTAMAGDGSDGTVINDASLVLLARTAVGRVLLTGDIESAGQTALLAERPDPRAEILKVAHHGSRNSSPTFLARVAPRIALVSVGRGNRYGHPNPGVVNTLTAMGATVARTDLDGSVAVSNSGGRLMIARSGPGLRRARDPPER